MALIDIQEQIRLALYDALALQFVFFQRVAVDLPNAAATGAGGEVVVAGFTGALLGDVVLFGAEAAWEAGVVHGVPQVSVAGSVKFTWANITAGALDPAANTCRVTVLRAM
jgi:hypothetical protein